VYNLRTRPGTGVATQPESERASDEAPPRGERTDTPLSDDAPHSMVSDQDAEVPAVRTYSQVVTSRPLSSAKERPFPTSESPTA
jgi:hypothetical protein